MPYASDKQRKFMYSQHPEIAARYEKEGKNKVVKSESRSNSRKASSSAATPKTAKKATPKRGKK